MNIDFALDDPYVVAWRIDDFADRCEASNPLDEWVSDTYAFEHPEFGSVRFYLEFRPKNNHCLNTCSLYVRIMDERPEISLKCKAWLERTDGTKSEVKTDELSFETVRYKGWPTFLTSKQFKGADNAATLFVCLQLPFEVKKVQTPSDLTSSHRWTISDFPTCFQTAVLSTQWSSNQFVVDGLKDVKFTIVFYPKAKQEADNDYCGLYLKVVNLAGRPLVSVQFEVWMESENGVQTYKFAGNQDYKEVAEHGRPTYLSQLGLEDFAINGPFSICCAVRPLVNPTKSTSSFRLNRQVAKLFNVEEVSDLEVHGSQSVFKISKLILCAQSAVFGAMLTNQSVERDSAIIKITDIDDSVLEAMLRFLYTEEVDNLKQLAPLLLPVADRYDLQPLVKMCTTSIVKNLSVAHALRDLKLAFDFNHFAAFKDQVFAFAHKNCKEIMGMPEWSQFVDSNPQIVAALLKLAHP